MFVKYVSLNTKCMSNCISFSHTTDILFAKQDNHIRDRTDPIQNRKETEHAEEKEPEPEENIDLLVHDV